MSFDAQRIILVSTHESFEWVAIGARHCGSSFSSLLDTIKTGPPTVYIGNQMASRVGDIYERSGVIVYGCPTVNIGTTPQIETLLAAVELGIPFCEECEQGQLAANAGVWGEAPS